MSSPFLNVKPQSQTQGKPRSFFEKSSRDIFNNLYTGLPTKNETLETIVRILFSPFSCIHASLLSLDQNSITQLKTDTKHQGLNSHIF